MNRNNLAFAACMAASMLFLAMANAGPSVYPTGVTRYDPAKAYNTFVLFTARDDKTYLIDMDGNEIRHWNYVGHPAGMLDPALVSGGRGHIMLQLSATPGIGTGLNPGLPAIVRNKTFGELDWNDKIVWQWGEQAPGGAARQHHDWSRLANGNTLVLANLNHSIPGFTVPEQLDDVIYEVAPKGDIVWQWTAGDHVDELGFTPAELALIRKSPSPDYFHVNNMKVVGPNHWFREGDQRFDPDNIIICSRNANFTVIIDRKTGHVVWRLGPNYDATPPGPRQLPAVIDQISGQHDAQIIPEGLPGAGNLLVFDNQGEAGYPPARLKVVAGSRVLEIDPAKREIVWEYTGISTDRDQWTFYSGFISNARRLPNGNTFINEGMNGRFFQVTPEGEIVWEYVSPYYGRQPEGGSAGRPVMSNQVYRAQPVPYDWVPAGTPHEERAVIPPDLATFRVPAQR